MKNMIFDTSAEMTDIYDLLLRLGVTANYIGFFHTAFAVHLAIQEPERLLLVTKCLYPEVAGQYQTNWSCVERNIRMIAEIAWNRGLSIPRRAGPPSTDGQSQKHLNFWQILAAYLLPRQYGDT